MKIHIFINDKKNPKQVYSVKLKIYTFCFISIVWTKICLWFECPLKKLEFIFINWALLLEYFYNLQIGYLQTESFCEFCWTHQRSLPLSPATNAAQTVLPPGV